MIMTLFLLLTTPSAVAADAPAVAASTAAASSQLAETKPGPLLPPRTPPRPKATLDTAGEIARDLTARVEYFENGQSYYRAYTKGSHTPEENKAFVQFLEDYESELGIARRTHAILGAWLDKKSSIKD